MAAGGASGGSLTAYGQLDGAQVVSLIPFTTGAWDGIALANVTGLSGTFSISEKIVITHTGAADGPKGDVNLSVPEPSTCVAGVCLLRRLR